ncbi:uncharacterized protein KQ657_002060 [Scheffersomyces spartinae]|uniref:Phosphatase n=1 Tax=Scheffersomyces spartinae TaxID=45513 RepID=A0A9P8AL32_9ASCO|nr:uncharacterized protein KQ657_002060 [Scheffersomyces spartinae]KAG7195679.1 hypothetical protein KQ657_002060 [Scheffersomyces spartinae]
MSTPSPAIVFTDWDGTVTLQDSNDYLTDNLGMGLTNRLKINDDILDGTVTFRDGFREMLESVPTKFNECIDILLKDIRLDPGFKTFYDYCATKDIPVVVVSSGMRPIIHALLCKLVGEEAATKIEIISNDVEVDPATGKWNILFKHPESGFGHDKAQSIKQYLQENGSPSVPLFYCGDGVSDLSAAKETNLLFAKHGRDLIKYCIRESIPYTEFKDFGDIHSKLDNILQGASVEEFLGK